MASFPSNFAYSLFIINLFITTYAEVSKISYNAHCSSIIPQAKTIRHHTYVIFPYLQAGTSYHTGGDRLFGSKSSSNVSNFYVSLSSTHTILETTIPGVYRLQANLAFRLPYGNFSFMGSRNTNKKNRSFRRRRRFSRRLVFVLDGFWSKPTGKVCMVGRAVLPPGEDEGEPLTLEAVFKLNYGPKHSNIFTSLAKGSLQSLSQANDPRYFEPIKIVSFPSVDDYDFKLDSGCVGGDEIDQSESISLERGLFCSSFFGQRYDFELEYASDCVDRQNCSPFDREIEYLPQALSLNGIQCFEEKEKVRILMKFSNWSRMYGEFDSRTTLLGEGSWDREKNQLCVVACKILHPIDSPQDARVDDCSTRLSLRFPAVWTIKNGSKIAGEIWTNKSASDPGYFKKIKFSSNVVYGNNLPKQKYVYTQVGLVQHSCYANKPGKNGKRYPDAYSSDMSFDISVKQSNERIAWGQASPISVGDNMYHQGESVIVADTVDASLEGENFSNISKPINISYKISIQMVRLNDQISSLNSSVDPSGYIDITAEGIYNPQTGVLCMVGCRELKSRTRRSNKVSRDCEILVNIEFPPLYSKDQSLVEGYIYTKREITDPLYFKGINFTSASYNSVEAKRSIWRVDMEIIMALVSNTFCVLFLASQIFYVKKHPEMLPFVSILMLGILTLGHLIPLVLNFEALILKDQYEQNVILRGSGWLEVNEVSVRVVTLVAFLLLFRLLQLAWTSRSGQENGKSSWKSEKHALFVSLPIYIMGGLISLFVNWNRLSNQTMIGQSSNEVGIMMIQDSSSSILNYLRSYTGLILDGYLFPQIIFNVFHGSIESTLSPVFYVGTTLVRLLPHAYDFFRAHNYIHQDFGGSSSYRYGVGSSYMYANHTADFYSIAWDVTIPCVCVLFAAIIYLQQRFGGDFIVPKKLREVQLYEKVPVETNE